MPYRLQWHRLQWKSGYSDSFLVPKRIFLYWESSDRVTLSYSDNFSVSQHCHCNRWGQYHFTTRRDSETRAKKLEVERCSPTPGYRAAVRSWIGVRYGPPSGPPCSLAPLLTSPLSASACCITSYLFIQRRQSQRESERERERQQFLSDEKWVSTLTAARSDILSIPVAFSDNHPTLYVVSPWWNRLGSVLFGPWRTGLDLPWTTYRVRWLSENATVML